MESKDGTREDVLDIKKSLIKNAFVANDMVTELCDYWLEQNKEKKIEKFKGISNENIADKLNEIIDVVNEMRVGR